MPLSDLPTLSEQGRCAKQKWDVESRVDDRRTRQIAKEANWRKVCKQVDTRDQRRCRACGERTQPDGIDLMERGHRHHLTYRSKGGNDVASNILTLCARCHDAEHRHRLRIDAGPYGGDGPVEIWRLSPENEWYLSKRESACGVTERD